MSPEENKPSHIQKSKNLITGGQISVGGNLHIGDVYISGQQEEQADDGLLEDYPLPKNISYPQEPFLGLQRFTRAEARIFYGRNWFIKSLIERLAVTNGAKVILLYGPSGVGKSSLLEAGLYPRLENQNWNCYYWRFNIDEDFTNAIPSTTALAESGQKSSLIVLDQLEEYYTSAAENKNEHSIAKLINQVERMAAFEQHDIRFVLSFRKEFLPEMESECLRAKVLFSKFFLTPLSLEDIERILLKLSKVKDAPWKLTFADPGLSGRIATELAQDDQSPMAPLLQLTMKGLWKLAVEENESEPKISLDLYRNYKKQGIGLRSFLNRQLNKIQDQKGLKLGLHLDVLMFFTTAFRSAAIHDKQAFLAQYSHLEGRYLLQLIEELKNLYLISEGVTDKKATATQLRLTHDALGPIVASEFTSSTKPGQRARRLLENKVVELSLGKEDKANERPGGVQKTTSPIVLNNRELAIINAGRYGMRDYTPLEKKLIHTSKARIRNRRNLALGILLGVAGLIGGLFWYLNYQSGQNRAVRIRLLDQAQEFVNANDYDKALDIYQNIDIAQYEAQALPQLTQLTDSYIFNNHIESKKTQEVIALLLQTNPEEEAHQKLRAHWAFLYAWYGDEEQAEKLFAQPFTLPEAVDTEIHTPEIESLRGFEAHYGAAITNYFKGKYLPELVWIEGDPAIGITGFWMARHEITNHQFLTFANLNRLKTSNPIQSLEQYDGESWRMVDGESLLFPVRVDGIMAQSYAQWLGGVLPTVEEWEYAARGGRNAIASKYPGGDELEELAIYSTDFIDARELPDSVGIRKPNSLGIFDLAGNVFEWTSTSTSNGDHLLKGGDFQSSLPEMPEDYDYFEIENRAFALPLTVGETCGIRFIKK
jgi:hypothetical protein